MYSESQHDNLYTVLILIEHNHINLSRHALIIDLYLVLACTKLDLAIHSQFLAIDWFNCNTGYVGQIFQLPYSSFLEWQVIQTWDTSQTINKVTNFNINNVTMNLKMTKKKSPLPYLVNSSRIYIARKTFHQRFKGSYNIILYSLEITPPLFAG